MDLTAAQYWLMRMPQQQRNEVLEQCNLGYALGKAENATQEACVAAQLVTMELFAVARIVGCAVRP